MLQTFEVTYSVRGDTGPARTAIVVAKDSMQAKIMIAESHMTAITNITYMMAISIQHPTIWKLA
jgi:hypothetical protein